MLSLLIALNFGIGAIVVNIIFSFIYNKIYIHNLMTRGFIPTDEASANWCIVNGLLSTHLFEEYATSLVIVY